MNFGKILLIILVTFAALVSGACVGSEASPVNREEVVLADAPATAEKREVVMIDETSLPGGKFGDKSSKSASEPVTTTNDDGSKTTVAFDGHGSRRESRCFNNDPRLKCVVVETAVDGTSAVTVYGRNGVIKEVSAEKIKDIVKTSADELAAAADLTEASQKADISKLLPSKNTQTNLKPLPSSNFPVFPKQVPTPVEVIVEEPPAETAEPPKPKENSNPESEN